MVRTANEQYGFVFAVTYILLFSVIVATIPADLQGVGETPDMVTPLDASLISGFTEYMGYQKDNFSSVGSLLYYDYDLGGRSWKCEQGETYFLLGAKIIYGGFVWLGQLDSCRFISPTGEDYGAYLDFDDIETDAEEGEVRYSLQSYGSGNSMGGFVVYWNTTTYPDPSDAWDNDELFLLHGMGIEETAIVDIGSLLLDLLFLQLPDVPLLISVLTIGPLWASIIYVIWFIFVNMVPFLGGG